MPALYIDTSDHIVLGLLSDDFTWIDYLELNERKSSTVIHSKIHSLCLKHEIKIQQIESLFCIAGPGSYTGMRLGEGISNIFSLFEMKSFSFYHFEVPSFLGVDKGRWVSNAFKKEIFSIDWSKTGFEKGLLFKDANQVLDSDNPLFTHFKSAIPEGLNASDILETSQLIKDNPSVFKTIMELKINRDTFYYRPEEVEFAI